MVVNAIPGLKFGNAICYSGYRKNQSPGQKVYPTYEQVEEDLRILAGHWRYLRMYDCGPHAETVLKVIQETGLPFQLMLGANIQAEMNNPHCPWGCDHSDEILAANARANSREIDRMIQLASQYSAIVAFVSVGNEATVEWTDHPISVERLISFVRRLKAAINQPVTFCENYVPWKDKLEPLAAELDFISVHSYPVWEYQTVQNALVYTQHNYLGVARHYPEKPVIITEAGWTTRANGRGIDPGNASAELQATYCRKLMDWSWTHRILTFVFEAFDEPWKGSAHPDEPEKHWGLFTVDRQPKRVMQELFPG